MRRGHHGSSVKESDDAPVAAALRQAESMLEHLQTWGEVGFWDLDLESMDAYWSTQVFRIFGLDRVSLGAFLRHVHPDDRQLVDQVAARACEQPGPYRAEHRFRRGDDSRVLRHNIQSVAGPDGAPHRLLGVVTDVTDVRSLQAEVDAAAALRSVGLVASSLMHTFKNQLAIVLGHSTLALDALDRDEMPARESLEAIQRAATHGVELTRQVLDLGRTSSSVVTRVAPGPVLERVAALAGPIVGSGNRVIVRTGAVTRPVLADADRLEHVIVDFVINAADALPRSGGHVQLAYRERSIADGDQRPLDLTAGHYGVFSVTDDGVGMDAATRDHASEPFFTTKPRDRGSGIGLTTASAFAREMGGDLVIRSKTGEGTTVELVLPLATPPGPVHRDARPRRVVVLVDDVVACAPSLSLLLDEGVQAVTAQSWAEVDRFLRTEPIDAVLVDEQVPFDVRAVVPVPVVPVTLATLSGDQIMAKLDRALP